MGAEVTLRPFVPEKVENKALKITSAKYKIRGGGGERESPQSPKILLEGKVKAVWEVQVHEGHCHLLDPQGHLNPTYVQNRRQAESLCYPGDVTNGPTLRNWDYLGPHRWGKGQARNKMMKRDEWSPGQGADVPRTWDTSRILTWGTRSLPHTHTRTCPHTWGSFLLALQARLLWPREPTPHPAPGTRAWVPPLPPTVPETR